MAKWSDEKIADLTRKLAETAIDYKKRCEELEAKLAKAVEALDEAVYLLDPDDEDIAKETGLHRIVSTLAELKGEDRG